MNSIVFNDLADYLRHGREIEFTYKDKQYSITNHSGFWYLCDDTEHILWKQFADLKKKKFLYQELLFQLLMI